MYLNGGPQSQSHRWAAGQLAPAGQLAELSDSVYRYMQRKMCLRRPRNKFLRNAVSPPLFLVRQNAVSIAKGPFGRVPEGVGSDQLGSPNLLAIGIAIWQAGKLLRSLPRGKGEEKGEKEGGVF